MMMNKRLIQTVKKSKKYVAGNVLLQWCSLVVNIPMMYSLARLLELLFLKKAEIRDVWFTALICAVVLLIRYLCTTGAAKMGYLSSKEVKKILREKIYQKLLKLGVSYGEHVKTSEVVQMAVEGVDQLETYFGAYLPQFFYAMVAPLTLFTVIGFINFPAAIVLLVCVPLIPVSIAVVQTWAKKLLSKYWGQYTALGDTFLENLQGLTTLKIYRADEFKQAEMNKESERFRKITMKVLTMQLNSITIMDLVAYGGAALGMMIAVTQFGRGAVSLLGCIFIILLAADFFIPMRQLGSFFHIAMNGMAASDKIFRLLDVQEENERLTRAAPKSSEITCQDLHFSYTSDREVLQGLTLKFPQGSFTALVGESGCGKSTIASILIGRNRKYTGSVLVGGVSLEEIREEDLMRIVTYIGHNSYLLKGTVRENLLVGNPKATEERLWGVLQQVELADFLKSENGLETVLTERASNFSGGQRQRLALARALLHDTPVYIFDEVTSNIDVESENKMMEQIHQLAKEKTIIMISHRLANVVAADNIYVLADGKIQESGTHEQLQSGGGMYHDLWQAQQNLENYGREEITE